MDDLKSLMETVKQSFLLKRWRPWCSFQLLHCVKLLQEKLDPEQLAKLLLSQVVILQEGVRPHPYWRSHHGWCDPMVLYPRAAALCLGTGYLWTCGWWVASCGGGDADSEATVPWEGRNWSDQLDIYGTEDPPVRKLRLAAKRPPCSPEGDLHQAPLWHPPLWPGLPPVTCFPGCRVNSEDCFKLSISMRCSHPIPLAPWCSHMAPQEQATEWRLAPAWSPPEEGRGCTWLSDSHQKPGGLSCRSQLHPQVLRFSVDPRQTLGVPAGEAQTRSEAGAENRPRSCPEWTHPMPVSAGVGL